MDQSLNAPSPIVVLYMAGDCPIIVRTTDLTETHRNPSISCSVIPHGLIIA